MTGEPGFRLRDLTWSVYVPTILFSVGQGAVILVIPLYATDVLGSSVVMASLMVAFRGIGQLIFDIPAGIAVSKWGDKWAMVAGCVLVIAATVGAAFSTSIVVYSVLVTMIGGGWAFWGLARLAYVSEVAPVHLRGRALSMVGGLTRVGNFIGPVIGGGLASAFGMEAAFIAQAVAGVLAAAMMFIVVREGQGSEAMGGHGLTGRMVETFSENRGIFLTAGIPVIALSLLRQARMVFLPLWGDSIGLDVAAIGAVTSISFFADAAVFYPVGYIMDRWGRKWAAVPCLSVLALSFLILPFTSEVIGFMTVAVISGVGNGFGSGINMTLGADFAPAIGRGEFLGLWRLMTDAGQVGGPMVISLMTGINSLGLASATSGVIGVIGAVVMALFVRETLRRPDIEEVAEVVTERVAGKQ